MSPGSDLNSGRPQVEPRQSVPAAGRHQVMFDLATEVAALAALLAEVVEVAGNSAVFPSRWELIAELALEHDSVRAALRAEQNGSAPLDSDSPSSGIEHIIAQLDQLRDLIGDGHARC